MAFVSLLAVAALCGCDKDDENKDAENESTGVIANNTVTVKIGGGNIYTASIDSVKMFAHYGFETQTKIASAPYSDGGFTLRLPTTVDDAYLMKFNITSDEVKISNPDVKILSSDDSYIRACNASGEVIGRFDYKNTSKDYGLPMYSNGNVTVTGTTDEYESGRVKFNLHLNKGWNMVYVREIKTDGKTVREETTQAPSGLQWSYFNYY
jgi:hypothetical protein